MAQRGSARGQLNTRDWMNSLKHTLFVALASLLTPLAQGQLLDAAQLKQQAMTAGATGALTLLARFMQDNR